MNHYHACLIMASDHAEACMQATNHTVTIINKINLTDDDFRRLNQGNGLTARYVCIAMSFKK